MKISLADHGLYYRGLLILIRKDRRVDEAERRMMMRIGKALGFEETFCAQAIHEILDNEYIHDEPPLFTDPEIARCFIRDGIRVATADRAIDDSELALLKAVACLHGLDDAWLNETVASISAQGKTGTENRFEAEQFLWN